MKWMLVTGGAGFIGSNFVYALVEESVGVVTLDAMTYAGSSQTLAPLSDRENHRLVVGSITTPDLVARLLSEYRPWAIVNFAAETHVDRSIDDPTPFIETNIVGVFELLQATRRYLETLSVTERESFRFVQVSTDEIYGSVEAGACDENSRLNPSSPYAASKAAADHLVRSWHRTYAVPVLITNSTNNFGPYQFPEKLIPHMVIRALNGQSLPIYGDGKQIRDWLYVEDHVAALKTVLAKGSLGETYNITGNNERTNIEVVERICSLLDEMSPRQDGKSYSVQIELVADRPGHDQRYSLDNDKIIRELGILPKWNFDDGLRKTVGWYIKNGAWWRNILDRGYSTERIGQIESRG